jgi:site-specific DNA-cytosine methylase
MENEKFLSASGGGETASTLDANYYRGTGARNGKEREVLAIVEPVYMSDRKGHNGVTEDGTATTLNAQEKERPLVGRSIVRRLTPHECLVLQGYPIDWCDIGDYTDENGRLRKEADTAKYKAAGNSIALPFWAWLFRRITAYYERPATMGSLFDGIGGFPLTALRSGIKPLWASEIEAFPIAVCKKHFGDEDAGIEGDVMKYL